MLSDNLGAKADISDLGAKADISDLVYKNIDTIGNGVYEFNAYDNRIGGTKPFSNAFGILFMYGTIQIAINIDDLSIYRRTYGNSWSAWTKRH